MSKIEIERVQSSAATGRVDAGRVNAGRVDGDRIASVPARAPATVAVFDFFSRDKMHLPFNEGYLRMLASAFPRDRIVFHASADHLAQLMPRLQGLNIEGRAGAVLTMPFNLSVHNPLANRWAAWRCLRGVGDVLAGLRVRLVAVLGVDAGLFSVFGRLWPRVSRATLHMILHGSLGAVMIWRSRNPLIRAGDFLSVLDRELPSGVLLIVLELGAKEAIAAIAPRLAASISVLEHPILETEWAEEDGEEGRVVAGEGIRIAFLGYGSLRKGFDVFAELARTTTRPDIAFLAIGHASPETAHLDTSGLARQLSAQPLSRSDYLGAIRACDFICAPLYGPSYDYTGSGTVSDAIALLKPLLALRNRTLTGIVSRYGPIGYLADSPEELRMLLERLDLAAMAAERPEWIRNLRRIRAARRPESLAAGFAANPPAVSAGASLLPAHIG